MKITLLLIVAWLAAVSAHSSLRHHESSLELLEDFKGRMLKKSGDTEDTVPSNDGNDNRGASGDNGDDDGGDNDTKKSRDNADEEEDDEDDRKKSRDNDDEDDDEDDDDDEDTTTRAHRRGHQRGGDRRFCRFIDIVDDGQDCLDDVIDAVNDSFEGTVVHVDDNCNDADDDEVTCLEISDSNDCNEVVDDALDELDEFCISDRGDYYFGTGERYTGDGYDHHDRYYYYHPSTIRYYSTWDGDGHNGDRRYGDRRDGDRRSGDRRDGDTGGTKDTDDTGHSRDMRH